MHKRLIPALATTTFALAGCATAEPVAVTSSTTAVETTAAIETTTTAVAAHEAQGIILPLGLMSMDELRTALNTTTAVVWFKGNNPDTGVPEWMDFHPNGDVRVDGIGVRVEGQSYWEGTWYGSPAAWVKDNEKGSWDLAGILFRDYGDTKKGPQYAISETADGYAVYTIDGQRIAGPDLLKVDANRRLVSVSYEDGVGSQNVRWTITYPTDAPDITAPTGAVDGN